MKIFANKNIWKKIVIIFLLISTLSFAAPKPVAAGIGGELMEPICDLLVGLGDGAIGIMHKLIIQQDTTLIRVDLNTTAMDIARIIVTVLAFAAVVLIVGAATAGVGLGIAAIAGTIEQFTFIGAIMSHIVPIVAAGIYFGVAVYSGDKWDNEVDLPMYSLTPEAIFKNNIPHYDVNFFNTKEDDDNRRHIDYAWATQIVVTDTIRNATYESTDGSSTGYTGTGQNIDSYLSANNYNVSFSTIINNGTKDVTDQGAFYYYATENCIIRLKEIEGETANDRTYQLRVCTNDTVLGTVNTFGNEQIYAFSMQLSKLVSNWYFGLRMLAIVGMMSVLVYIGIRILLSSTSPQKAKYKQLLGDWLVGMVLLFTMHYIMIVANIFTEHFTELLSTINPNKHAAIIEDVKSSDNEEGKIEKALKESGINVVLISGRDNAISEAGNDGNVNRTVYEYKDDDGKYYIEWHTTLMGQMRLELMYNKNNDDKYIGYTIMYIVMIMYILVFAWTYIKRVILMAFLTLIAPLVALTYPIDKVNDGKAQGFNYWFKEYIFNLLLQPMHLLIYTVLVSSAIELATTNWVYSLVALGFIASAEKIVRQMFNFSKANTPGAFSGAAGAALAFSGMRYLLGRGPKGGKGGSRGNAKNAGGKDADGNTMTSTGPKVDVGNQFKDMMPPEDKPTKKDSIKAVGNTNNNQELPDKNEILAWNSPQDEITDDIIDSSLPQVEEPELLQNNNGNNNYIDTDNNPIMDSDTNNDRINIGGYTDEEIDKYIIEQAADGSRRYRKLNRLLGNGELTGYRGNQVRDQIKSRLADKRAIENTMSYAKDQIKQNFKRSIANADPINSLGRLAAGVGLGATAGMIGVASATVSGDPNNIWKMGGAAAALGGKTGMGIYDDAVSRTKIDGVEDVYLRSKLGEDEYKKVMVARAQKAKAEDEAVIRKIQEKMKVSREDAKKLAQEWAPRYMNEKINDVSDWINIEKMRKEKLKTTDGKIRNYTPEEAISAYKIHKRSGFEGKDKEKALKKIQSDWNLNEQQAKIYYQAAKVFDDIKNS